MGQFSCRKAKKLKASLCLLPSTTGTSEFCCGVWSEFVQMKWISFINIITCCGWFLGPASGYIAVPHSKCLPMVLFSGIHTWTQWGMKLPFLIRCWICQKAWLAAVGSKHYFPHLVNLSPCFYRMKSKDSHIGGARNHN